MSKKDFSNSAEYALNAFFSTNDVIEEKEKKTPVKKERTTTTKK